MGYRGLSKAWILDSAPAFRPRLRPILLGSALSCQSRLSQDCAAPWGVAHS